jgi:MscS family membrane protein
MTDCEEITAFPNHAAVISASSQPASFSVTLREGRAICEWRSTLYPWRLSNLFLKLEDGSRLNQLELPLPRAFFPQKLVAGLRTWRCLLPLVLLSCSPVWAQVHLPASKPPSAPAPDQPEFPKDPLGRTTPRSAVLGFLTIARSGNDEHAAQYLNTKLRGEAAAVLAHQLFVVLDRRLPARLNQISDLPEGSLSDPLKPDQELIGTISGDKGNLEIFVERVNRGSAGSLWLFSSKTLESIPDFYDEVNVVSVYDILPDFLVNTRLASIALFEWLAVFVGMPLVYFLTVLLNRVLSRLIGMLRRYLYRRSELPNPVLLPTPARLLFLAFVIHWAKTKISLPLLARQFWSNTATVITIAASVWLLILFASWCEESARRHLRSRNHEGATSMLRLARWVVDLLIIVAGVLVTLKYFDVNATAALAGLGVGGIAIALAAQRTLENVIGGVSLIFDQALRVGDILKVGETSGAVEDIGLRSTRIRTFDRTVVIVPNGQFANMILENLSSRDLFWFHPILALRNETTSPQLLTVLEGIRSLLEESRHLDPASVRVRLLGFGPSSLNVEIFGYIPARDWNHFLDIQERLLLRILECIESSGVQFAFPLKTILAAAPIPMTPQSAGCSNTRSG